MLSRCLCHFLSLPRSIRASLTIGTVIADDDDCCVILFTFSVSYLFCISFAVTFLVVGDVVVVFCEGEVTALLYSALTAAAVCSFSVGQMGNSCCCYCCFCRFCFAFCLSLSFVNCSSFFTNGLEHLLFVLLFLAHSLLALPSFDSALVALYFAFFRQERRRDCKAKAE